MKKLVTKMSVFGSADSARKEKEKENQKFVQSINLDDQQVLQPSQINIGPLIGKGGFAKVYSCTLNGEPAVAKVIDSQRMNEEMTYLLTNECTIWARLKHRNICSFFGMAPTSQAVLLICELLPDGALQDKLEQLRDKRAAPPSVRHLVTQLQQISSGMEYLHSLDPPVLHRDLKSANILLAEGGDRLAIADFGLARYQAAQGKKMTAETGSYRWMAPEVIRHEEYDQRCDVYSFAILAWEMLTYKVPFTDMMPVEAAFAVAREAKRPAIPPALADSPTYSPINLMLTTCWHQQASKRPPFSAISTALEEELHLIDDVQSSETPEPAIAVGE